MSHSYVIKDQSAPYFLTFRVVAWLDVFTRQRYRDIMVASLNYCVEHKQLSVHAWVIMSNHVHCILKSRNRLLSNTIRDMKRHSAQAIIRSIRSEPESRREWILSVMRGEAALRKRNEWHQFWNHDNHAVELSPFVVGLAESRFNYLHENPVRAGIVASPEDYLYSSARDYAGKQGLVKVDFLW
jgi:putative transposase